MPEEYNPEKFEKGVRYITMSGTCHEIDKNGKYNTTSQKSELQKLIGITPLKVMGCPHHQGRINLEAKRKPKRDLCLVIYFPVENPENSGRLSTSPIKSIESIS